jgi:hypothetical protein
MRALPLLGALLVGLTLCGTAAAQSATSLYTNNYAYSGNTTSLYQNNYSYSGKTSVLYQQNYGGYGPNTSTPPANNSLGRALSRGGFSPRGLFQRFQGMPTRPDFGPMPSIPNPVTDKAAYIRAIGLRPLQ